MWYISAIVHHTGTVKFTQFFCTVSRKAYQLRRMAAGDSLESQHAHHQQHLSVNGPPTSLHQEVDSGGSLVNTSKSAFIDLQQHTYNTSAGIRSAYHPHHFSHQSLQPNTASLSHHHSVDTSGFVSSRTSLSAYPFSSMHQNSQTGYLGSYTPQCPSPAKDGEFVINACTFRKYAFPVNSGRVQIFLVSCRVVRTCLFYDLDCNGYQLRRISQHLYMNLVNLYCSRDCSAAI